MIKAIIFDCFGVIRVDYLFAAYESLGGDVAADRDFIIRTVDAASAGRIPSSIPILAEKLGVADKVWMDANMSGSTINQDLLDYVLELRKSYKTAMLTNIGIGGVERIFKPNFLDAYFEIIVSSGDIGFAKPEPEAYEITAQMLGVRLDECVFIDDRQPYVDGALAVGMESILYSSNKQLEADLSAILGKTRSS
jgi:FMN phosphatase YigB (HAD superfamily)